MFHFSPYKGYQQPQYFHQYMPPPYPNPNTHYTPQQSSQGLGAKLLQKASSGNLNIESILNNIQKVLGMAEQITPMIQQYGPLIKSAPALIQMLKESSDDDETEGIQNNSEVEEIQQETISTNPNNPTEKEKPKKKVTVKQSVPKLYI